jgi:hypothetical protein
VQVLSPEGRSPARNLAARHEPLNMTVAPAVEGTYGCSYLPALTIKLSPA